MSEPRKTPTPADDEGDYIDIRDSDIIEPDERRSGPVQPVVVPNDDESVLAMTVLAMLESR